MMKRKKDGGFTLIELMIVIAVIGILAVVLVPKISGVKDSAKETGVVTNAKSVEAFVVANMDRWINLSTAGQVKTEIDTQFINNPDNQLSNPLGGTTAIQVQATAFATGPAEGVVRVLITPGTNPTIEITGYGINSAKIFESKIKGDGVLNS